MEDLSNDDLSDFDLSRDEFAFNPNLVNISELLKSPSEDVAFHHRIHVGAKVSTLEGKAWRFPLARLLCVCVVGGCGCGCVHRNNGAGLLQVWWPRYALLAKCTSPLVVG